MKIVINGPVQVQDTGRALVGEHKSTGRELFRCEYTPGSVVSHACALDYAHGYAEGWAERNKMSLMGAGR